MSKVVQSLILLTTLGVLSGVQPAHAMSYDDFVKAVKEGKSTLNFRYRYEFVDQDGIDEEANASTLKGRLSWTSGQLGSWTAGVEADCVAAIGSEKFNSTENGQTEFPVVADPTGADLNQAWLKYSADNFTATVGRQRINHGGQRFIGGVAWRQNEQTYDALRTQFKVNDQLSVDYSYIWNVNRIFGPGDGAQPGDWRSNSHLLNATFTPAKPHKFSAFAYLLDFENDNGPPNSTSTYGLNYAGAFGPLALNRTLGCIASARTCCLSRSWRKSSLPLC